MAEGTTQRNEVRTKMPILDILDEDAFENINTDISQQTEVNFYRGAPPQWLNFYLDEKNKAEERFTKRDGYDELRKQIEGKFGGITYVLLNHKPGSGGTTLAMQLLWDLRKTFKCAVLTDPTLESSLIATAVIDLYAAGKSKKPKTVLLLVQDGKVHTLRGSFVAELSKRKIDSDKPVVIIVNCVRIAHINAKDSKKDGVVNIVDHLSVNEAEHFKRKKNVLLKKYTEENGSPSIPGIIPTEFHGFNIMQSNFSQDYVQQAWVARELPVHNEGVKFIACLCLLNCYVPGSFILKTDCEKFLKTDTDDNSFENKMGPFHHLMVSFNSNESDGQQVLRMAHPMIANQGTQILHDTVMKKSDMAQILLQELCTGDDSLLLSGFIKNLLTKRMNSDDGIGNQRFSRLILDIKKPILNGENVCLLVLKEADKKFPNIASYAQTLSRFYYLENSDFSSATEWALKAKEIAPLNSFIADTLGEVYKYYLYRKVRELKSNPNSLTEVLDLAEKAFKAFEHGEFLAEEEQENRDGLSQQSKIFNYRPKIAYLQVANELFGCKGLLATSANQYSKYENLISNISNQIEKRAIFIKRLLSHTQESSDEKYPEYVLKEARKCYEDYICKDWPEGLEGGHTEDRLRELHRNWPNDTQKTGLNLKSKVKDLKSSFQETYEKYFRSRYLLPLLYLEKSPGIKARVRGEVRCYKVYITVGDEEIQLDVDHPSLALLRSGTVFFHLGFTIRGPTACDIQPNGFDKEAITGGLL